MENEEKRRTRIGILWAIVMLLEGALIWLAFQFDDFFFYFGIFLALCLSVAIVVSFSRSARKLCHTKFIISVGVMLVLAGIFFVGIYRIPDYDHDRHVGTYKINTHYSDLGSYDSTIYNNLKLELTDTKYKFTPCPPFLSDCEGEWKLWNPEGHRNVVLEMNGEWIGLSCYEHCTFDRPPPAQPGQPQVNTLEFTMIEGGHVEYLKKNKANLERNNK